MHGRQPVRAMLGQPPCGLTGRQAADTHVQAPHYVVAG
jgi:hypothetical protein